MPSNSAPNGLNAGHKPSQIPTVSIGGAKVKPTAAFIVPIWILLSSSVIIYNNYLYNTLQFKYPVFLVTWHLIFASIGTRVLARTTHLLDAAKTTNLSKDLYIRSILPIAVLFCGSLVLSNKAYLFLSVGYIQMLKAFNPVAILLISFAIKIKEPSRRLFVIVLTISFGVCMASYGELHFNLVGFIIQALAVLFESSRLVMVEILLQGIKMDPLVSLHYFAPPCALLSLILLPLTEGWTPIMTAIPHLGFGHLFANAMTAFMLNVAAVWLVGVGGGLVLTLAGVFKDILLITGSTIIFSYEITVLQIIGYAIALAGLITFKTTGNKK
ncbi:TPT-domain-containing protein [Serendipita vermifera]|nr:TPT-domain-containing protein [Serendipita vermifera]